MSVYYRNAITRSPRSKIYDICRKLLTSALFSAIIILHIKSADKEYLMYIRRHAERTVTKLSKMFGAVLVAGPRQVGKTTMLDRITDGFNHATLDDPIMRAAAEEQSGTFFLDNPPPVFVDEIQKAPALFEQIKLYLDRDKKKVSFICVVPSNSG